MACPNGVVGTAAVPRVSRALFSVFNYSTIATTNNGNSFNRTRFRAKPTSLNRHHCYCCYRFNNTNSIAELRSPDLVALEYAELNLKDQFTEVRHVRLRQHVNPLSASLSLVKRAQLWVKELTLSNIYFMFANATISFNQLVSTYPGYLKLVSILCPDPHFKRRYHKRRVVQKPLVDSIINNLSPRGEIFLESDVLEVALDMKSQFHAHLDVLESINTIYSNVLCDDQGWLLSNPMGIRTEREIHAESEGAKIYRMLYRKTI